MPSIVAGEIKNSFHVAVITSRFNEEVTRRLYDGAMTRLNELSINEVRITSVWVPGAVEIPIVAQRLARLGNFAAIICLGAVIRGDTTHYDYVCEQVSQGCQKVALENDIPVIFGVLTTENDEQAFDRAGGNHGNKGRDAVDAAMEMISILHQIG